MNCIFCPHPLIKLNAYYWCSQSIAFAYSSKHNKDCSLKTHIKNKGFEIFDNRLSNDDVRMRLEINHEYDYIDLTIDRQIICKEGVIKAPTNREEFDKIYLKYQKLKNFI